MSDHKEQLLAWTVRNIAEWPTEIDNYLPKPSGFQWFSLMSGLPIKLGSVRLNIQVTEDEWREAGGGIK